MYSNNSFYELLMLPQTEVMPDIHCLGRELHYHKLVLAAVPFNRAGAALYDRPGFREVGVYREQGQLAGERLL